MSEEPQRPTKETILLAEDDRFVSDIYKRKLTMDGYDLMYAPDGGAVLKLLEEKIPDLILLDIMMPVFDGMEVLAMIKKDDRFKNIPVIMLTNLSERHQIDGCLELGANGYIIKAHFTPSEVMKKVREVLDGR